MQNERKKVGYRQPPHFAFAQVTDWEPEPAQLALIQPIEKVRLDLDLVW